MANVREFDFTGAPPAQGSSGSDRVPVGQYVLKCKEHRDAKTKDGLPMLVFTFSIAQGPEQGKQLVERFVIGGEKKFPLQRFHALLLAFGAKLSGEKVRLDLDTLIGRNVLADVTDNVIPETAEYPERTVSQVRSFFSVPKPGSQAAPQTATAAPPKAPPVRATAPVAAVEETADGFEAQAPDEPASIVEELDSIFD